MVKFAVEPHHSGWAVTITIEMGASLVVGVYRTKAEANAEALRLAGA